MRGAPFEARGGGACASGTRPCALCRGECTHARLGPSLVFVFERRARGRGAHTWVVLFFLFSVPFRLREAAFAPETASLSPPPSPLSRGEVLAQARAAHSAACARDQARMVLAAIYLISHLSDPRSHCWICSPSLCIRVRIMYLLDLYRAMSTCCARSSSSRAHCSSKGPFRRLSAEGLGLAKRSVIECRSNADAVARRHGRPAAAQSTADD